MSEGDGFDYTALVAAIAEARPVHLDRSLVNIDHVEWAIAELEEKGIHPTLRVICQVIGRGTQRTLQPLVDGYYRGRAAGTPREWPAKDQAIGDLYDAIAKHVRDELRCEFDAEALAIELERSAAEKQLAAATQALQSAEQHERNALAMRESLQGELDRNRDERTQLIQRIEHGTAEIAQLKEALSHARQYLSEAAQEQSRLVQEQAAASDLAIRRGAACESAERRLAEQIRESASLRMELAACGSRAAIIEYELECTRDSVEAEKHLGRGLASENRRVVQTLKQVQSRLARERAAHTILLDQLTSTRTDAARVEKERRVAVASNEGLLRERDVARALAAQTISNMEKLSRQHARTLRRLERCWASSGSLARPHAVTPGC